MGPLTARRRIGRDPAALRDGDAAEATGAASDPDDAAAASPRRRLRRRGRPRRRDHSPHGAAPEHDGPARTSSWTAGRSRATRLQAVLVWIALACGPVALVGGLVVPQPDPPAPAAAGDAPAGPTPAEQLAGSQALGFVGAWLAATRDDRAGLDAYLPGLDVTAAAPTPARDLALDRVEPGSQPGLVRVVVAATVREAAADGTAVWERRHYQVALAVDEAATVASVLGPPALVAAPSSAVEAAPPGTELAPDDPVATATGLFLTALLTGSAELDRFVAPGAPIAPIEPAAYAAVVPGAVRVDAEPPSPAADGAIVRVAADVLASTAAEDAVPLRYWLTLTARDGRWEVSSIDPGPWTDPAA